MTTEASGVKALCAAAEAEIETWTAEEAIARMGEEDLQFVDIRDVRELWREGTIPGATHAPRGMLEFWVAGDSPYAKDVFRSGKRFVFFCAGGLRSALATQAVQDLGLAPVAHIAGGFAAWREAGGPVEAVEPRLPGAGARTRTFRWDDPAATAAAAPSMSGLEFLRAIVEGRLPQAPMAVCLDFELTEIEEGHATFRGRTGEYLYNPMGTVHGGWYGALLDSALGCAVYSILPAGQGFTTLEYKVNLVRRMTAETGEVIAEGWIVHPGRRIATAEAKLTDKDGKLYAHGSTTCLLIGGEEEDAGKD